MSQIGSWLMNAVIRGKGGRLERDLKKQIINLQRTQEKLLLDILRKNLSTEFARDHKFDQIKHYEDFRRLVPVCDYETLRPYIEKQDRTRERAITHEAPVFYAVTSGTTGKPKYIPLHAGALKSHQNSTNLFLAKILGERPKLFSGKILAIVSPAVEGHTQGSGTPFGSTSGHMYEDIPAIIKKKYLIPASVFAIQDYDLKYQTILRLALQEANITYLSTANPSTIAKLVNLLPKYIDTMIVEIATGAFQAMTKLTPTTRNDVVKLLKSNPERARALQTLVARPGKIKICDLWPNLQAVTTWTGGSSSIFLDQLKDQFPEQTLLRDLGYLASEFRGSVPITSGTNAGLPTFWNGFYEFVEQNEWDNDQKNFLGLHELENQKRYYIFITTDYGLYRYHMNDIIEVDGTYLGCPLIRFLQKGKGVTSITGEKLYESQVLEAVAKLEREFNVDSEFFIMSCSPEEARYTLYYELAPTIKDAKMHLDGVHSLDECSRFQKRLDEILGEINIEYVAKRQSGRVHPLRLCILKRGTYDIFKRFFLDAGQREGQFKIVALQFARDVKFDFSRHIGWDSDRSDEENVALLAQTRHAWTTTKASHDTPISTPNASRPTIGLEEAMSL